MMAPRQIGEHQVRAILRVEDSDFRLWPTAAQIDVRYNVGYWEDKRTRSTQSELFAF